MVVSSKETRYRRKDRLSERTPKPKKNRVSSRETPIADSILPNTVERQAFQREHRWVALKYAVIFGAAFAIVFSILTAIGADVLVISFDNKPSQTAEFDCEYTNDELSFNLTSVEFRLEADHAPLHYAVLRCVKSANTRTQQAR
jgi:hypothetical protein